MDTSQPKAPNTFVSYSWDDEAHKAWVATLSTRLRNDGVNIVLDRWETAPGDQLPAFMERAVRENEFVLVVCTPRYKEKSDERLGGVGYEGDIMTAEVFSSRNRRKFIPLLRLGTPENAIPSWLGGTYFVDLREGPHGETNYQDLLFTLHRAREKAPPLGPAPSLPARPRPTVALTTPTSEKEPIRITGILVDHVGTPKNDGTQGSALYAVPFQLSRRPSSDWAQVFVHKWDSPPEWTTMHRPGIARVEDNAIVLDGTTVEEIEKYHRKTLILAVNETNRIIEEHEARKRRDEARKAEELRQHEVSVKDAAKRISFE